ncbi:ankyrin-2 [Patella vulgata]|uniref:ankyrin-2 n=1 Tax=Patella vulgata TaxID=6465 RepID=UPI00217FAC0F|nr:ankyrin-2 [Patella vulgata]
MKFSAFYVNMEGPIEEAVRNLNPSLLLSVLSAVNSTLSSEQLDNLYFIAVKALSEKIWCVNNGIQTVYLLRNLGAPINRQDKNGDTPLLQYLKMEELNPDVVEAFLRCNSDVYATNNEGCYPLDLVTIKQNIPKSVKDVFMRYVPGIWEAVEGDDAMNVRKLVNQWCRVDVQQNGKSLLQLSLEVGNENIIRVVSCIRPSMDLAHGVLSGDVQAVKNVLDSKRKININFRNMGDKGATPLYYALKQGNRNIVNMLLEHGARVDLGMKADYDYETDIPMYFAVLGLQPPIQSTLLKQVTPKGAISVDKIFYKGKNVLFHCIDETVRSDVVDHILHLGSAYLVTQSIEDNMYARDYAQKLQSEEITNVIDKNVRRWIIEGGDNRKILFLHNYPHIPQVILNSEEEEAYTCLPNYYKQITRFHEAVEDSDYETTRHLLEFMDCRAIGVFGTCLADSKRLGDGQSALHKAVLRRNVQIVQLLAETLVYQQKQRIDSIRDQFFRTPLHYAYGMENETCIVNILLDYGASEFTMDKNGRSPLAFKDRRGQQLMNNLLEYQLDQVKNEPEPDPWSVPMPMPIIGYLLSCSHPNHLASLISHKQPVLTTNQRRRSVPEIKIRQIASTSASIASHLTNFTESLRSRLVQRTYRRHVSADKDYHRIPTDDQRLDDHPDHFIFNAEAADLLCEREIKHSSSCIMQ